MTSFIQRWCPKLCPNLKLDFKVVLEMVCVLHFLILWLLVFDLSSDATNESYSMTHSTWTGPVWFLLQLKGRDLGGINTGVPGVQMSCRTNLHLCIGKRRNLAAIHQESDAVLVPIQVTVYVSRVVFFYQSLAFRASCLYYVDSLM